MFNMERSLSKLSMFESIRGVKRNGAAGRYDIGFKLAPPQLNTTLPRSPKGGNPISPFSDFAGDSTKVSFRDATFNGIRSSCFNQTHLNL